jgi:hypothetical protein
MKKQLFLALICAATLTACEEPYAEEAVEPATASDGSAVVKTKKFTFTLKGDFSDEWKPVTRGYLQAYGKDLTDLWVLDYDGEGNLLQQLHQDDNTATDFGQPVMKLAYGQHHVYFIASRGTGATLNTDAKTITFTKVLDTFYKDYEVTVVSTSNGNRAVTLDRVVTKLKLIFNDAIPSDAATFNVIPTEWYYGLNYSTGSPVPPATSQPIVVNIPSTSIGVSGESVNVFGFSTATEWTTDVTVNSKTSGGDVMGSATIANVPFKANRVSEYTGPLFGSGGTMTMSLDATWETAHTGTW